MKKATHLAIIALLVLTAGVCSAQQRKINRELSHLPPPVRKAIRARLGDARLDSVEKESEDGETTYDVEITPDGKSRGFTVDESGSLVDEEVFLNELPPAVQRAINQRSGGATLGEIDRSDVEGEVSYDVEIERSGKSRDITIDNEGRVLEEQVFMEELPTAARQTISREAGAKGVVGEIDKDVDAGETNFDAELTAAGKTWHVTVGADGKVIDREVFLDRLPDALRSAIAKEAGADAEVHQCFDGGEVTYEVEKDDGTVTFDPDGKLLSKEQDVPLSDAPEAVQSQIKSLAADGKCLGITKTTEDDETYYDVDLKVDGKEKEVSISIDGKIIPDDGN